MAEWDLYTTLYRELIKVNNWCASLHDGNTLLVVKGQPHG